MRQRKTQTGEGCEQGRMGSADARRQESWERQDWVVGRGQCLEKRQGALAGSRREGKKKKKKAGRE